MEEVLMYRMLRKCVIWCVMYVTTQDAIGAKLAIDEMHSGIAQINTSVAMVIISNTTGE